MKHELYIGKTSNGQGLVIESETGRNVAVTYDEHDAPGIVKAVNNHERLVELLAEFADKTASCNEGSVEKYLSNQARSILKELESDNG